MKFKKMLTVFSSLALAVTLSACGSNNTSTDSPSVTEGSQQTEAEAKNDKDAKKIAVLLYQADDTYIASVRQELEKIDKEDPSIEFVFSDGQNNQGTQTDQINNVVSQGVDGILLNIVDVKAASTAMSTIEAQKIPTVFFNRDMTESLDESKADEFLFVGTNADEAGVMQGEMLADLWEKGEMDRNGNGKLDYVMLNGGVDNPEAKARTEYSVKTLKDKGIEVNEIALQDCAWETEKAKTAMDSWLQTDQDNIDAVISNNDGMAIGAITSLQAVGFNKGDDEAKMIPVVGVDATEQAKEAISKNTMYGTVLQDAKGMAEACSKAIKNKIDGKDWTDGTDLKLAEDKVSIRVPYQKYEK
ncbi:MAG: galactose ABC transporter substrate-binding protein [Tissierellia bacterium]|nr:galactose ABC transporter substrate-binding protein [Tissierellia bacterium]